MKFESVFPNLWLGMWSFPRGSRGRPKLSTVDWLLELDDWGELSGASYLCMDYTEEKGWDCSYV